MIIVMKNPDRRTQRTRTRLQQALIELILEKGYDAISIRDITERAHVGYATYFRHYDSKEALLADAFEQSTASLKFLLHSLGESSPEEEGRLIFEHVEANHDLYSIFLRSSGAQALVDHVEREAVKELVMRYARYTTAIPAAILANHMVASIIALIKWWLRNDMPFSPEQMGKIYARLIVNPVEKLALPPNAYQPQSKRIEGGPAPIPMKNANADEHGQN